MTTARAAFLGCSGFRLAHKSHRAHCASLRGRAPRLALLVLLAYTVGCQPESQLGSDCNRAFMACGDPAANAPITEVDILFVVDNSASMAEEQQALAQALPALLLPLLTGDRDWDGVDSELTPPESVHLGVISTDLGLPDGAEAPDGDGACYEFGDDGRLQYAQSGSEVGECNGPFRRFVPHTTASAVDDPETTSEEFGCMLQLGTDGCGFRQPLEAALKALWPSDDDRVVFRANTRGYGDTHNDGFLRDGALLAVIVVTDGEDCSAWNERLSDDPNTAASAAVEQIPDRSCYHDANTVLHGVERYVTNLKRVSGNIQDRVIFGVVAGIPPELVDEKWDLPERVFGMLKADTAEVEDHYARILNDSRMQLTAIPEGEERFGDPGEDFMPACTLDNPEFDPEDPGAERFITKAMPARRLVEVALGFGTNGVVQSICRQDLSEVMRWMLYAITNRMVESTESIP